MDKFREIRDRAMAARRPKPTLGRTAPRDGKLAFRQGFGIGANPYPYSEPGYQGWKQDWLDARDES